MAQLVWQEASREQVIAGAVQMVLSENGTRSYQVAKETTSRKFVLEGGPSDPEWTNWISRQAAEEGLSSTSEADPDLDRAKNHLSKLKKSGTYVGYVGATEVTAPFSITCDGVKLSSGRLVTWEGRLLGLLQCDRTPTANTPGAEAKKYC